jgi:hypothetical protein
MDVRKSRTHSRKRRFVPPKPQLEPSGARESSAGDDFHLLWAARKALALLDPKGELEALAIEGPAPQDAELVDPEGHELLGIDLAEYIGGATFADSRLTIHSQLKYSTRLANRPWTVAHLCQGRIGHRGSIFHRLAQIINRYISTYGRDLSLSRLRLKLVSNRPLSEEARLTVEIAQETLRSHPGIIRRADLLKALPLDLRQSLERIDNATQLASHRFSDFLRVIDLSACGTGSRLHQTIALSRTIGALGFSETTAQYSQLKQLILTRMMPEARSQPPLTREDILPYLGVSTPQGLFPAMPKLEPLEAPVKRAQMVSIGKAVTESGSHTLCLHAGAGFGKTTSARLLGDYLPNGSFLLLFDCYGAGSYLDPAETRHSHRRALTQIANELAVETGSPLLLGGLNLPPEDLLRALVGRLETAAKLLRAQHDEALLVLVVDAADNSIAAANREGTKSFVQDLVRCHLPDGCRLVLTCRSHRLAALGLPPDAQTYPLLSFSSEESAQNLRRRFPDADSRMAREFDRLSQGIPRVQSYALSRSTGDANSVLEALRPHGKTVDNLIAGQLRQARLKLGDEKAVEALCSSIISLPRPVPVRYVSELAEVDSEGVRDFCLDMWPGLVLNEECVSFRDEDIENYFLERFHRADVPSQVANLLIRDQDNDAYAAIHLAASLYSAGRGGELRSLVLEDRPLDAIPDPLEKRDTFVQRARLALQACANEEDRTGFVKLLFIAAEAAKTDQSVRRLVLNNADLVSKYGDARTVQQLYLSDKDTGWYGPGLLRCAAVLSRKADTMEKAREHLRSAEAWLRWWSALPLEDREDRSISISDIAAGTEAVLRLQGPRVAKRWLLRWRPRSIAFDATSDLADRALPLHGGEDLKRLLGDLPLRADLALTILEAYQRGFTPPPTGLLDLVVKVWRRFLRFEKNDRWDLERLLPPGVAFCEIAAKDPRYRDLVRAFLQIFSSSSYSPFPASVEERERWDDAVFRGRVLLLRITGVEVTVDALLHLQLENARERSQEKDAFEDAKKRYGDEYGLMLPAYNLRAGALLQEVSYVEASRQLGEVLRFIGNDYRASWTYSGEGYLRRIAGVLAEAGLLTGGELIAWFQKIERTLLQKERADPIKLRLVLAEKAVTRFELQGEVLRQLDAVREELQNASLVATEQVSMFVRCARLADTIDPEAGRKYFQMAMAAVSEVDEEAFPQLICISEMAEEAAKREPNLAEPKLAYELGRFTEACYRRMAGWDHFPWTRVLRGLAYLDPASGFATISRWDDRRIRDLEEEFLTVLEVASATGFLEPDLAYALWVMASPFDSRHLDFSLHVLSKLKGSLARRASGRAAEILDLAVQDLRLYIPLSEISYPALKLKNWADENEVEAGNSVLLQLVHFFESLSPVRSERPNEEQRFGINDGSSEKGEDGVNWAQILSPGPFSDHQSIGRSIESLSANRNGSSFVPEFLERIKEGCPPAEYLRQLEALLEMDRRKLPLYLLIDALEARIVAWQVHPSIRDGRKELARKLVGSRFPELIEGDSLSHFHLSQIVKAFGLSMVDLFDLLAPVLPGWLREMSATALFEAAKVLTPTLSDSGPKAILTWLLPRLTNGIPPDVGDGPWQEDFSPPRSSEDTLAEIFWSAFGHPDKKVRWRASHAIRRMVRLGYSGLLGMLIRRSSGRPAALFRDRRFRFYNLSARLWLVILLDRLSCEAPDEVLKHAHWIADEALSTDLPHALIRHFATRAALAVESVFPGTFSDLIMARLRAADKSSFQLPSKSVDTGDGMWRPSASKLTRSAIPRPAQRIRRFRFDDMDTVRYWYSSLAGIFGISSAELTSLAENWICDHWGFSGDVLDDFRRKQYDYYKTSNDHGSEPEVETLRTYFEYHSMFCAAGQLLAERPLVRQWDDEDPWRRWLQGWNLTWDHGWLADRRDTTPLEAAFWRFEERDSPTWETVVPSHIFEKGLGLDPSVSSDFMVLSADVDRRDEIRSESLSVVSALVSERTAPALLRALQTVANPLRYRIPPEGEYQEIQEAGFELSGWIKEVSAQASGIDETDPLRNSLSNSLITPGRDFCEWADLEASTDRKRYWRRGRCKELVTRFEQWNDIPRKHHLYGFHSSGYRLWCRVDAILSFLKERRRCMIIECKIHRSHQAKELGNYDPDIAKIFLLWPDGTLESLQGSRLLGQALG